MKYKPENHIIETRECTCGCGKTFEYVIASKTRFIKGHNAKEQWKSGNLKAHQSWNKGLTKENDERVLKSAESQHGNIPWNKGLTKETDERVAKYINTGIENQSHKKAAEKLRQEGYFDSEKFKIKCLKPWKDASNNFWRTPSVKRDNAYKQIESKKKENGFYEHERVSASVLKGVKTIKENDGYDDIVFKRLKTMKQKGTIGKQISKCEQKFYELFLSKFLCCFRQIYTKSIECKEIFGNTFDDYKKRHQLDFIIILYGKPIIVCFDGIYFHGLDRSICDIAKDAIKYRVTDEGKVKRKRAHVIFDTYYRDRSFEDYCQKKNIPLIRFNDFDFEKHIKNGELPQCHFSCGQSSFINIFERSFQ